jgi:hypothetical protein
MSIPHTCVCVCVSKTVNQSNVAHKRFFAPLLSPPSPFKVRANSRRGSRIYLIHLFEFSATEEHTFPQLRAPCNLLRIHEMTRFRTTPQSRYICTRCFPHSPLSPIPSQTSCKAPSRSQRPDGNTTKCTTPYLCAIYSKEGGQTYIRV